MCTIKRCCLGICILGILGVLARPCAAQVLWPEGLFTARAHYVYNKSGQMMGARVGINLVDHFWVFDLDRQFLDLPLHWQLNMLDAKFGLGLDRVPVARVLREIRLNRLQQILRNPAAQVKQMQSERDQLDALRRQLERLNQLNQMQQQQTALRRQLDWINRMQRPFQPATFPQRRP